MKPEREREREMMKTTFATYIELIKVLSVFIIVAKMNDNLDI